jgi:UDP-N-acetyl-D-mannosaminuronic acid transferase (WecB/TagA/CpsF family)
MVQKSAQVKLFDQMDKEETEESTGQSLEQTKSMQKENLNADQKSQVDQNKAYRSFVDANAKPVPESAPIAVVEKKAVQAS